MKRTLFDFAKLQRIPVPPVLTADLTGKTVLVTGANTGIGYEAAKHFAKMNPAKIIIACRVKARADEAITKLKQETGYTNFQLRLLDLSKFSSVIEFSDKLVKEEERLDIVVANASIAVTEYRITEDGWESTVQVNNLSTLLSSILLVPILLRTAHQFKTEPRLVIVGSGIHYLSNLQDVFKNPNPLRTLSSKEYCTKSIMDQRYTDSKLLTLLLTRALANALSNTPIVTNVVDPGYCYSELRREANWIQLITFWLMDVFFGRSADEGSRQYIWAALAENTDDKMRGAYVDSMAINEPSDFVISKQGRFAQEKLWDNLIDELTKVEPRVKDILDECTKSSRL